VICEEGTSWVNAACSTGKKGPISPPLGLITPITVTHRHTHTHTFWGGGGKREREAELNLTSSNEKKPDIVEQSEYDPSEALEQSSYHQHPSSPKPVRVGGDVQRDDDVAEEDARQKPSRLLIAQADLPHVQQQHHADLKGHCGFFCNAQKKKKVTGEKGRRGGGQVPCQRKTISNTL